MAKALTAVSVEKLRPEGSRREIPDALMPGLYLVIQPSGSKSWAVRYRHGGRPRKLTVGGYPAFDLAAARKKASEALQAAASGADPARQKKAAKAAAHLNNQDVFPAVARLFIARHARPNNKSWKEAARLLGLRPNPEQPDELVQIKGGLVELWNDRPVREIGKRDVLGAIDDLVDGGTGTLANRTLSQIRKLFNWAVERDIALSSPCIGLKAPIAEESRDRVLTDDEIRWLWNAAEMQGFPFGPMTQLLLLMGQRRSEIAGMRLAELSIRDRMWHLPKGRTKNGEAHDVPLADRVISILRQLPKIAGDGFAFTSTGVTPVSGFSRAKAGLDLLMMDVAAKEKSKGVPRIESWIFHDLRRTCASGMASLGIAPHIVEAVLNHKSGTIKGVAAVYNRHRYVVEKRQALEAWANRVAEIVDGERKVVRLRARGT
jgi:integrase